MIQTLGSISMGIQFAALRNSIGGRYFSRRYSRRMSLTLPRICIFHVASRMSRPRRKLQFRFAHVRLINIDRDGRTRSDELNEFLFLRFVHQTLELAFAIKRLHGPYKHQRKLHICRADPYLSNRQFAYLVPRFVGESSSAGFSKSLLRGTTNNLEELEAI